MWYCIACYCRNLSVCLYELHGFCGVVLFCLLGQNPLCLFCTNVCSALNSSWRYKSCVSWEIESEKQLLFIYSLPHSLLQLRGLFKETNLSSINSLIIITTCGVSTPLEFKSSAKWNMDKEENLFQIEERFIITSSKSLFKMHRKIPEISVDFLLHSALFPTSHSMTFQNRKSAPQLQCSNTVYWIQEFTIPQLVIPFLSRYILFFPDFLESSHWSFSLTPPCLLHSSYLNSVRCYLNLDSTDLKSELLMRYMVISERLGCLVAHHLSHSMDLFHIHFK